MICRIALIAAVGLALPQAQAAPPVFTKDVAPIFFEHCVKCHRPNDVAPMSLLSYDEARPWAKSIRKNVEARTMPPWTADPAHGKFSNDLRLPDADVATILAWVDAGAPQGDAADLPPAPELKTGWQLGEPDYVVELAEVRVPAAGDDLFPTITEKLKLEKTVWVRAIEFLPEHKSVAHHILCILGEFGMTSDLATGARARSSSMSPPEIFSVWVAGSQPTVYPEGMGREIRNGATLSFNAHYHPNGQEVVEHTKVGLFFGQGEMKKRITTTFAVNTGFLIPPGADNHPVEAFYIFDQDSRIVSFLPHMHVRGKAMKYTITYPDGRREVALNVPRYDYNWQWIYYPEQAISVPAGTRVDVIAHYDNSAGNPANPDPTKAIKYRDETFQEMMVGFMEFVVDEGVAPKPAPPNQKVELLLANHPVGEAYRISGVMGMPWGLHVPRKGDGTWYIAMGSVMFTNTLRDLTWDGDSFRAESTLPTPTGGGVAAFFKGEVAADGTIRGEIHVGDPTEEGVAAQIPPMDLAFTGAAVSAKEANTGD